MSTTELYAKVKELKELTAMKNEVEAEIEALKDAIKREMGENDTLQVGEYTVRNTTVVSSRFDTTAFKKAHTELYLTFCRDTVSTRFTVA